MFKYSSFTVLYHTELNKCHFDAEKIMNDFNLNSPSILQFYEDGIHFKIYVNH